MALIRCDSLTLMKRLFLFVCCGFLTGLDAEVLRVVEIRELAGGDKSAELKVDRYSGNLEAMLGYPSVSIPRDAEVYVSLPADRQPDQWLVPQGSILVAMRLPDEKPLEGTLYLRDEEKPTERKALKFSFDPSKSTEATQQNFDMVRKSHYARLAAGSLPGSAWFRHLAGGVRMERNGSRIGFDTTFQLLSGSRALAENLALDRELLLADGIAGEPVAIDGLKGITVSAIDWKGKIKEGEAKVDALSLLIPHDQHAYFAPSMKALYKLIGVIEKEGSPLMQSFDARSPYYNLPSRYQAQLGLDVPEIVATSMPVDGVAVTGGDPFFPSGTDIAVVLASKSPDALLEAISKMIEVKAKMKGATAHDGGFQTADRAFSSYVAKVGDAVVVSNSPVQLTRLKEVAEARVPSLGSLDEFKYFRQRYPADQEETGYLFLSDATIRRWSSPQVRIAASRRTRAAAALGEQVSRHIEGKPPVDEFAALLGKSEALGATVRSEVFNTLGFLTPISELELKTATPAEAAAYDNWRSGYENGWAKFFDPIAIRLRLKPDRRDLDLCVMPLTVDSDYRDWMAVTGTRKPESGAMAAHAGAQAFFSFAIDPESETFRKFGEFSARNLSGLKANSMAWVGDSLSVYLDDSFFWRAMQAGEARKFIQANYLRIPVGVRIASRSSVQLALFLSAMRAYVNDSAPDLLNWEQRKHGDKSYIAVISKADDDVQGSLFYAALNKALVLSLDEKVLQQAIDRESDGAVATKEHLAAAANTSFLKGTGDMFDITTVDHQRRESWAAIPILNEWHRLTPEKDPVQVHAERFQETIACPGGKGYRWNEAAGTMESVVFGHPGEPRGEEVPMKLLAAFPRLQAGVTFEEDGLVLRASMGPSPAKPEAPAAAAEPEIPAGFPQLRDLIQPKEGNVWKYRVTESSMEAPYSKEVKFTGTEKRDNGNLVRFATTSRASGEDEPDSYVEEFLLGDGYQLMSSVRKESSRIFSRYMPVLPAKLAPGISFGGEHRCEEISEEGRGQGVGELRAKIIGLEDITVPAGTFEKCVRIDSEYDYFAHGRVGRATDSIWYAPGVGLVKMVWKDDFSTGTEELEKFEQP